MPRPIRLQDAGYIHHVVCRGNDRQILFNSPQDFLKYLDLLDESRRLYPCQLYNYVLMDNHIHLLLEPVSEGALSKFMEYVSKGYAKYFNKKYGHEGHVFQGRFKSFLVQSERYLFTCSRYIDLNPVKANMVSAAKDYAWSGHAVLGYGERGALRLDKHPLYESLGDEEFERQIAYRAIVNNLQQEELDLLNQRACILGDKSFKKEIRQKV